MGTQIYNINNMYIRNKRDLYKILIHTNYNKILNILTWGIVYVMMIHIFIVSKICHYTILTL